MNRFKTFATKKVIGFFLVISSVTAILFMSKIPILKWLTPVLLMLVLGLGIFLILGKNGLNISSIASPIIKVEGQFYIPWFVIIPSMVGALIFFVNLDIVSSMNKTYLFVHTRDASPVSETEGGLMKGYCEHLFYYLKEEMRSEFSLDYKEIDHQDRFGKSNETKNLLIECGASTITRERTEKLKEKRGFFSDPFAHTGAKLLVNKEILKDIKTTKVDKGKISEVLLVQEVMRLDRGEDIKKIGEKIIEEKENSLKIREALGVIGSKDSSKSYKIMVLEKKTTSSLIKNVYPHIEVDARVNKKIIKDALDNNEGFIYASDEILLKEFAKNLNKRNDYIILPDSFLSSEYYGIVVYDLDNFGRKISDKTNNWISDSDSYIRSVND